MQKRLKTCLKRIFLEAGGGLLLLASFLVLCCIPGERMDLLQQGLKIFIIMLVITMMLFMFVEIRKLYENIVNFLEEVDMAQDQSDSMSRDVISNITHDLRTPLTAIKGYAQGILDGVAGSPERMNKYVLTIRNKADDMAGLVDELSFFTHMYQGSFEYQWLNVNVIEYFSECISEVSLDLETRNISLVYRFEIGSQQMIRIDKDKLKRVINNIIGNASKYIQRENGIVLVNIEETEEDVLVHITDNGAGIAKKI